MNWIIAFDYKESIQNGFYTNGCEGFKWFWFLHDRCTLDSLGVRGIESTEFDTCFS